LAPSVCFLFVYRISLEPLNGFAPNSHKDVFGPSLATRSLPCLPFRQAVMSLQNKQLPCPSAYPLSDLYNALGQRSRSPGTKWQFLALTEACMQFVFDKTSLASFFISLVENLYSKSYIKILKYVSFHGDCYLCAIFACA